MTHFLTTLTISILSLQTTLAVARDRFPEPNLNQAQLSGTGCVKGEGARVQYKDGLLLITAQGLSAVSQQGGLARSACSMALPIEIPQDTRLEVTLLRSTGFIDAIEGNGSITSEAFLAGQRGPVLSASKAGVRSQIVLNNKKISDLGECGAPATIRANLSVLARDGALAVSGKNVLRLRLISCN